MNLIRALTVASGSMQMEPERLRSMARALTHRQAAQATWKAPPCDMTRPDHAGAEHAAAEHAGAEHAGAEHAGADEDRGDRKGWLDASLMSMQASHSLLTRAIDMLK